MTALLRAAGVVLVAAAAFACKDDTPPPAPPGESSLSVAPVFDAPAASASERLLTYAEIGPGFVPVPFEPTDPSTPAPCGGPSADSVWRPEAVVGAEADLQAASVQVVEEVRVYSDDATAAAGFDALVAGFACPSAILVGAVASVVVSVAAPVDMGVGTRIDVTAAEFVGSFVLARSGQDVVMVEVFAPPGSPSAPDAAAITAKAVAKLRP